MPDQKEDVMVKKLCCCVGLAVFVALIADAPAAEVGKSAPPETQRSEWELAWSDEFEQDVLDDAKWTRCARGTSDWNNTMSDHPRLLKIENGVLYLLGIVNDTGDAPPYLTAGLNSKGKFAFKYGKVQIRARFKNAQGAWPALWMLGAKERWPACGEPRSTGRNSRLPSNRMAMPSKAKWL